MAWQASVPGAAVDNSRRKVADKPETVESAPGRMHVELLESRVLYSADALSLLVDADDEAVADEPLIDEAIADVPESDQGLPESRGSVSVEVVFVNFDLEDRDTLLLDLVAQQQNGRHLHIHILDDQSHVLEQIDQALDAHGSVAAVHVLSHGNDTGVQLGGTWFDLDHLDDNAVQISDWQAQLADGSAWMFYGCDLAASEEGIELLNRFGSMTGAEVFASADTTGHKALGGDWDLEYSTADGQHESLLSEAAQQQWHGELAAPSLGNGTLADISEDDPAPPGETISNIFAGQFSVADGSVFTAIAIADDVTGSEGAWQYSTNGGSDWYAIGAVTHDAALVLDINTMLRFIPAADENGAVPALTLYAVDSSYTGGVTAGVATVLADVNTRGASTPYAAASATIDSTVIPVNDAPALGNGVLRDVVVNPMNPAGDIIANIFDGQFSDVDNGAVLEGIAIVADDTTTEGTWEYSTNSGNWFSIGSVSTNAALLLHESTLLRFNPATDFVGQTPTLSVYGVDGTGGPYTAGGARSIEDVSVRGGSSPYAVGAAKVVSSVVADFAANDDVLGPVLSGSSLNFLAEDFTDNDAFRGAQAPTIQSVTLPTLGSLAYSGLNGNYIYSSPAGSSGVATFNYSAMDGSPDIISQWRLTNDGADDLNQNNGTVTTDDAPGSLVFDGDDHVEVPNFSYPDEFTLTFDFRVNDLDNDNEEALFSQGVWENPNYLGIWINGKDEAPGRHLVTQIWDSTDSGASYTPDAFDVSSFEGDGLWHNYTITIKEGVGYSVYIDGVLAHTSSRGDGPFTPAGPAYFGAEDLGGGTLNYYLENHEINNARLYSGFDLPTVQANQLNEFDSGTVSITVRNEETLVNNNNVEVDEDQKIPITNADLRTTDIEDSAAVLRYEITIDASYGTLVLNGVDLNAGDSFTQKDIDDGNLEFRHNGSETATADSVTLQVDDGAGSVTTFAFTITIQLDNDLPVLSSVESATLNYIEGDDAVVVSNTIAVSDADNVELTSARVEFIAGYESAEDELLFVDTASISGSFNSALGILTLTGTGNLSAWQDALRSIQYRNSSESPEDGTRTLSFTVNDGTADSLNADRVIRVFAVNDAPVMGNASLASVAEDTPDPDGEAVSNLFYGVYTDVDGILDGVAIAADATSGEGQWEYSTDNGVNWYSVGAVSSASALAIDTTAMLRFVPSSDFFGAVPVLTLYAIDDSYAGSYSSGPTRVAVDVSSGGGSSAYAGAASLLGSSVTPVGPADLSSGITLNTDGGNDSYLLANDGGALLGGLSALTVEAQFELESPTDYSSLFSYNSSAGEHLKLLVKDDGIIRVGLLGTDFDTDPIPELVDGRRHSVAASWDSTDGYLRIYADGELVKTEVGYQVGQSIPGSGALVMGLEQDGAGGNFETDEVFTGTLYDIRVWNEARSPAEIAVHQDQKLYIKEQPASLIANWQMDGVNGIGNIEDAVSGNDLTVEHATDAGFSNNVPITRMQVAEDAAPGTVVGSVQGSYSYRGEDRIQDGAFTYSGDTVNTIYTTGNAIGGPAGPWVVNSGNVEVVPTWDSSPSGGPFVDLVGTTTGMISQAFAVEPGKDYVLNFALSGDFQSVNQHQTRIVVELSSF